MSQSASMLTGVEHGRSRNPFRVAAMLVGSALLAGFFAAAIATLGLKTQLLALGAVPLVICILVARDRSTLLLGVLIFSLQFLFYKALGPVNYAVDGGAPGLYLSTAELVLALLYWLWMRKGSLRRDLRVAAHDAAFVVPIALLIAYVPSFVAAEDIGLATAELLRVACGVALYVYIGAALKTRRELTWAVASLFAIAAVQCLVVLFQWKTGSSVGVSVLGQGDFAERVTAEGAIIRPNGTLFYSTVLGLVLAPIGLLGLGCAITARSQRWRLVSLAAFGAASLSIFISQARSALLAMAIMGAVLILVQIRRGQLPLRVLWASVAVVLAASLALSGPITRFAQDNIGTAHFWEEVDARNELLSVALNIIRDAPIVGVGLNNYSVVMDRYEPYGVAFPGFPVHNLYLLTWAETGVVGLLALLATLFVLIRAGIRLSRAPDPFFGGLGVALAAGIGVFVIEGLTGYTLRHTHATLVFWLLAGLVMAAERIALRSGAGEAADHWPVLGQPR